MIKWVSENSKNGTEKNDNGQNFLGGAHQYQTDIVPVACVLCLVSGVLTALW